MKHRGRSPVVAATLIVMSLAGVLAGCSAGPSGAPAPAGGWGIARTVPGLAALASGGHADLDSVSCASAGNCSAAGTYFGDAAEQAFAVSEVGGRWQRAREVPGTAALNKGGGAEANSVSCTAPGDCSAGGYYEDRSGRDQSFVVSEVNGRWQQAQEVPGSAALNASTDTDALAGINAVSCASPGNCAAGGVYSDRSDRQQLFVVSEVNGVWQQAQEVPGSAALNADTDTNVTDDQIDSVSCATAGNCLAGGYYSDADGNEQAIVVSESGGRWQQGEEVPGTAALNHAGLDAGQDFSVSCAPPGYCAVGGDYLDAAGNTQAFVASESGGHWQQAQKIAGTAPLEPTGTGISALSCPSAGDCSAAGYYTTGTGIHLPFVVSAVSGRWQQAVEVPGAAALNQAARPPDSVTSAGAQVFSVSCASAGNCSAGGSYSATASASSLQAFVVSEVNGRWQQALPVPGASPAALHTDATVVTSVSCPSARSCAAGGNEDDSQVFAVARS